MVVKEYDNARAFLENNESLLIEKEAVNQLILYGASDNPDALSCEDCLYGAVVEKEKTLLLFSDGQLYQLVICVVDEENLDLAAAELANYFVNRHIVVEGINARWDVSCSFIETYQQHMHCTFVEKQQRDIMEIRQINEIKPVEGIHRLAHPQEVKLIADWIIQFQMETLASEMDYEIALEKASIWIEKEKIYVYENSENEVVSMAVVSRKLIHGAAITHVFTPEEYKGSGFAVANVYYLSKYLLEEGNEFCTLFVDKNNTVLLKAYEKLGYQVLEDIYEFMAIPMEAKGTVE